MNREQWQQKVEEETEKLVNFRKLSLFDYDDCFFIGRDPKETARLVAKESAARDFIYEG
jgi:hypothetical protein